MTNTKALGKEQLAPATCRTCKRTVAPYFNTEADNFYCPLCEHGMGTDYYAANRKPDHPQSTKEGGADARTGIEALPLAEVTAGVAPESEVGAAPAEPGASATPLRDVEISEKLLRKARWRALEAHRPAKPPRPPDTRPLCTAITRRGNPCTERSASASGLCNSHAASAWNRHVKTLAAPLSPAQPAEPRSLEEIDRALTGGARSEPQEQLGKEGVGAAGLKGVHAVRAMRAAELAECARADAAEKERDELAGFVEQLSGDVRAACADYAHAKTRGDNEPSKKRKVSALLSTAIKQRTDAEADAKTLREALAFYANPETYFGIGFLMDPPCGEFGDDFSDTDLGTKPGKRARTALSTPEKQTPLAALHEGSES